MYNPDGSADVYTHAFKVYDNQMRAARNIVDKFIAGMRLILLVAQMQLGKTGTMQEVIATTKKRLGHDVVPFVIVPVHDNEVLLQAKQDFTRGGLVPYENIFGTTEIGRCQYLKDAFERAGDVPKLIIIDESHMSAGKDQALNKLLSKAGILVNGDQLPPNVYILTVSATPNAETALLTYREVRSKKNMVVLEAPDTYYGVSDMLQLNRLREAWSLTEEGGVDRLIDVIEQFKSQNQYMMIRCHDTKTIGLVRDAVMDQWNGGVKVIDYSSNNRTKDINTILSVPPNKPTIILLARRLCASKRLDTQNVSMCFGKCGEISTTMQGLLGRCCGHHKEAHGVIIYTDMKHAKIYSTWCQSMYSPFGTPTDKGHYVTNGVSQHESLHWAKYAPVEIHLDQTAIDMVNDHQKGGTYGHMTSHFRSLWQQQHPRLSTQFQDPIKQHGLMVIHSQTSYDKFWVVAERALAHHNKVLNFGTTDIRLNKQAGWFMYINKETKRCIVHYSKRVKPSDSAEPLVDNMCSFKPSGPLTRLIRPSLR